SHHCGRALPRRDRRLAPLHPDSLRRPRPRALVAGARRTPARLARARGERHLVGRWHRAPPPGRGGTSAHGRRARVPRGSRGPRRAGARRLGAVRLSLPRERGPCPSDPETAPGPADAALAAAAEGPGPVAGGTSLLRLPDRARDVPRVPPRRVRHAGPAEAP